MRNAPILYTGDDEVELPWKWAICPRCDGHNRNCEHVECDGGGFTSDEWAEQDDDFKEAYLRGDYDRPCPYCEGGRVKQVDWPKLTRAQKRAWNAQVRADREDRAIERMERMMGA